MKSISSLSFAIRDFFRCLLPEILSLPFSQLIECNEDQVRLHYLKV